MPVDDPNEVPAQQIATKQDIRDMQKQIAEYQSKIELVLFGKEGTQGILKDVHALNNEVFGSQRGFQGLSAKVEENRTRIKKVEKDVDKARTGAGVLTFIFGSTVAAWIVARWDYLEKWLTAGK